MLGNLFGSRHTTDQQPVADQPQSPSPVSVQPPSEDQPVVGSSMQPTIRQDLSILTHLDNRAASVLTHGEEEAKRIHQEFIEPEQLMIGLLFDGDIFQLLSGFKVDPSKITLDIQSKEQQGSYNESPKLSDASKKILEQAFQNAKKRDVDFVSPEDILYVLFLQDKAVSQLKSAGVTQEQLEEKLAKSQSFVTGGKGSVLDKYGIDLTAQAKKGELDPIAGRDTEIERLSHILLRRTKNNPILIGEAGVGKTAVVEGLAEKIAEGSAPKDLSGKRIIMLSVASLVAGASHRGEFEERLQNVIKESMASSGQIILFIDEIHTLIGTGDTQGAMDASNIIKPYLARGQLQIIGTTTTAEYRKYFEKDKAFARRFQPVMVEEPSEEVAIQMLETLKAKYENYHKVVLTPEALKAAVFLSKKYIGERYLPDKAVDLLDEAAAQVRLENQEGKRQDNEVKKPDIERVVSGWTGIPITKLTEDESKKLLQLEDLIHERLIDQQEAVQAVAEAVRRGRIGLSAANRPIASFMFLGPTGVGKTELAKTLAEILFGKEDAMIRLDMSEYMEKHEVAKLIGAPPGYVGYEEGGQLTEAVRKKPYSIVLLDEVEKAHPDVFNILLQLLEDGRLTDNKGNTISFKNTIIIATSNIGSALIQKDLSDESDKNPDFQKKFAEVSQKLVDELHKFFRPELLNRFDEIVIFKPLRPEDMKAVAKLGIEKTKKLLQEQGYGLQITEPALDQLAKEGYDPLYGARPLRRLIQTALENPISLMLISKQFVQGDVIVIGYDPAQQIFTFTKGQAQSTPQTQPGTEQKENIPVDSPKTLLANQPPVIASPPVQNQTGIQQPASQAGNTQMQPVT